MKKRILSIFLSLAMCLTLLPTTVWAEEDTQPTIIVSEVAEGEELSTPISLMADDDGTVNVFTEEQLRAAVESGSSVRLMDDITLADRISIKCSLSIDLNGYAVTAPEDSAFNASKDAIDDPDVTVTILDSRGGGKVHACYSAVWSSFGSTITIDGGEYFGSPALDVSEDASITVLKGTFPLESSLLPDTYPIFSWLGGTLTLKDATFTGQTYSIAYNSNTAMANLSELNTIPASLEFYNDFHEALSVSDVLRLPEGCLLVDEYGGTVADTMEPREHYTVLPPEASWGNSAASLPNSGTLAEALAAAAEDSSVKHVRINRGIDIPSETDPCYRINGGSFTIDLNGQTLTSYENYIFVVQCGNITFTDSSEGDALLVSTRGESSSACEPIYVWADGDATANVTFEGGTYQGYYALGVSLGNVTINDGTFRSDENFGDSAVRVLARDFGDVPTLTINGGTLIGNNGIISLDPYGGAVTLNDSNDMIVMDFNEGSDYSDYNNRAHFVYNCRGGTSTVDLSRYQKAAGLTVYIREHNLSDDDCASVFTLPKGLNLLDSSGQMVDAFTYGSTYYISSVASVTFDAGETGSGTMAPTSMAAGFDYTLPQCTFTGPEGMIFAGWNVNDGETYEDYICFPNEYITIYRDTTLTALWGAPCTVTFYANNGTDASSVRPSTIDSVISLPHPEDLSFAAPESENGEEMVFAGWANEDGGIVGGIYDSYLVEGDVNLYAQWEKEIPIYVGGVAMENNTYLASGATEPSSAAPAEGGYAYYKDDVLTLHDYVYEGPGYLYSSSPYTDEDGNDCEEFLYAGISVPESLIPLSADDSDLGLTLVLEGTSSITLTDPDIGDGEDGIIYTTTREVIRSPRGLTVTGDGALTLSIDENRVIYTPKFVQNSGTLVLRNEDDSDGEGIYSSHAITINGGTLDVEARTALFSDDITINDGDLTLKSTRSGLCAAVDLEINGGTVDVSTLSAPAIQAGDFLTISGYATSVTATTEGETAALMSLDGSDFDRSSNGPSFRSTPLPQRETAADRNEIDRDVEDDDLTVSGRPTFTAPSEQAKERPAKSAVSRPAKPAAEAVSLLSEEDEGDSCPAILAEDELTIAPYLMIKTPADATVDTIDWQGELCYSVLSGDTAAETVMIGANKDFNFTVQVGNVLLETGSYLASGADEITDTAPADGGYASLMRDETSGAPVLTLNNFAFSGSGYEYLLEDEWAYSCAIYSEYPLEMVLVGENILTFSGETDAYTQGIETRGNLTVSGTGSLELNGYMCGIYTGNDGSLIQKGGQLLITAKEVTEEDFIDTYGVYADMAVTISGGTFSATPSHSTIYTYDGNITVSGGEVSAESGNYGFYSEFGNITVSGGKVSAESGYYGFYSEFGNISITGGTVTLDSYEDCIRCEYGTVFIRGGNVTLISTVEDGIDAYENGVSISGGTITMKTGDDGIYSTYGNVYVTGGTLSMDVYYNGIYTEYGNISFDNGNIDIYTSGWEGIYTYYGDISITNSTVTMDTAEEAFCACCGNISVSDSTVTIVAARDAFYADGTISVSDSNIAADISDSAFAALSGDIFLSGSTLDLDTGSGIYANMGSILMENVSAVLASPYSGIYAEDGLLISGSDTNILVQVSDTASTWALSAYGSLIIEDAEIQVPVQGEIGTFEEDGALYHAILDQDIPATTILISASEVSHTWSDDYVISPTHHWHPCLDEDCFLSADGSLHEGFPGSGYEEHVESGICVCGLDQSAESFLFVGGKPMQEGQYLSNQGVLSSSMPTEGGYAHFSDGVLTLNNYAYTGAGVFYGGSNCAAVYCDHDLDIVLKGTNYLENLCPDGDGLSLDDSVFTVSGSGSLEILAASDGFDANYSTLTFLSGTITITTTDDDGIDISHSDIYFKGGTMTLNTDDHGIECSGYTGSGDNVYFCGGNVAILAGDDGIDESRTITVSGGTVRINSKDVCFDAYDAITITGGDVSLISKTDYAIIVKGDAELDSDEAILYQGPGSLTVTGGELAVYAYGDEDEYFAAYCNGPIVMGCGMEIAEPEGAEIETLSDFPSDVFDEGFDVSAVCVDGTPVMEFIIRSASGSHSFAGNGLTCDNCGTPSYQITQSESSVTVTLAKADPHMTVMAASYENGQMTGFDMASAAETTLTLGVSGTMVRIFFLDQNGVPLIPTQPVC